MYRSSGGRNNTGKKVIRTNGRCVHKRLRCINHFSRDYDVYGSIMRVEYDPTRSAYVSLIVFANGCACYVLHTSGTSCGSKVVSYINFHLLSIGKLSITLHNGDSSSLLHFPQGMIIHDLENIPYIGGIFARSAGAYCLLLRKFSRIHKCTIQLPSTHLVSVSSLCNSTKGIVGNYLHHRESLGKAGTNVLYGKHPIVRGVAKNPIDHPHGGGEGKKSKKCLPRTA